MKTCKICGCDLEDDVAVCPYCGEPQPMKNPTPPAAQGTTTAVSNVKYCSHCGKEIDAQAVVCPHCGVAQGKAPAPAPTATAGTTNIFAILGLIFSVLGGLLGLIFSIVGLVQAPKYGGNGKNLAIAGICLSVFWFILIIILVNV